ncbi:MAG: hypothetical protein HOP02_14505 [Methylococcaceae bacterium]|nr:hypothetical protein [Methylococcaceae bacterium]
MQVYTALIILLVYRQPQHPQRHKWIQHAHRLLETNSDSLYSLHLSINLLIFSMWFENSTASSRIAKIISQMAAYHSLPPLSFMLARALTAAYHWSSGDAISCFRDVDEGLQSAQTHGIVLLEFLLSAQGVYGGLINGNLDIAEVYLKRMEAIPMGKRYLDIGHYRVLIGLLALQRDDMVMAIENFEIALAFTLQAGTPFPEGWTRATLALALSQAGQHALAQEQLLKAQEIATTISSQIMKYMCLLANAYIDLEHNRQQSGLDFLRRAFALDRESGGLIIGYWGPKVMTHLYAAAISADIETAHVQNLIRSMHLAQFAPDNASAQWPWPVKVDTLGEFKVYIDGEALHFSGKVQHKPLELLMALIAFGGCNVPQTQIIDALWPDAEGDAGYRALITAIHRLRKLLNCQQAIVFSDGTLSIDQHYVQVDVQHFGLHRNTLIVLTEQECALFLHCYKGSFLAEIEASWVLKTRARLRDYYQIALRQTGETLEYQGKLQDATALYLNATHVEPGLEILHQHLIRVYLAQQRNVEALEAFGNCKCLLASLQNRNPSRETEALVAAVSS